MLRRRHEHPTTTVASAFADLHEWVLSLPWVVERPDSLDTPGVRCFGIDCAPLGRRQLWLITGMPRQFDADPIGLGVIIPVHAGNTLEKIGWGRVVAALPARHVFMTVHSKGLDGRQALEALVLAAYGCAMS